MGSKAVNLNPPPGSTGLKTGPTGPLIGSNPEKSIPTLASQKSENQSKATTVKDREIEVAKKNNWIPMNEAKSDKKTIYPDVRRDTSRLTELKDLSRRELVDRYKFEFSKEPDASFTDMELIEAIESSAPAPPAKKLVAPEHKEEIEKAFYGAGDHNRKYKLHGDWKSSVVVRQVRVQELHGGMVEVPNTEQIQTYAPDAFQRMLDNKFFSESQLKIEILNDPRGSKDKKSEDDN